MPKIPEYPALTNPSNNDQLVIEDAVSSSTKSVTREAFLKGTPLPADTVDEQSIESGAVSARTQGDTGWVAVPASTGHTSSLSVRKIGSVVYFSGSIKRSVPYGNSGTLVTAGTIPVGFRPPQTARVVNPAYASSNTGTLVTDIETTGDLKTGVNGSNTTGIDTLWLTGMSYLVD